VLERVDVVANGTSFRVIGVPNTDSPIVGAREEDRALLGIPVRVAPDTVDWSSVAVVVEQVLLGV
jgi:hypothetical protein